MEGQVCMAISYPYSLGLDHHFLPKFHSIFDPDTESFLRFFWASLHFIVGLLGPIVSEFVAFILEYNLLSLLQNLLSHLPSLDAW